VTYLKLDTFCYLLILYFVAKSSDTLDSREHPPPPSVVDNDMPVFTRPLCDIPGATRGETVVLVCKVVARLQPMVLWYRNSQLVPVFSQRYEQSYDGDVAQLTIHSVSYDVVGVYECSARNAYGKVTSACRLQLTGRLNEFVCVLCEP